MKSVPLSLACLLLAGIPALADSVPKTVLSLAPAGETPATARIAPSSNLSPPIAYFVAGQLSPAVAGTEIFTVVSTGSMRPAFDNNTVLLTEPARFQDLQIGDIVVFRHSGTGVRIVHRIIERRKGGYWTKGDHNRRMDDELVTESNYIGRVYGIIYTQRSGKKPGKQPSPAKETSLAAR